MTRHLVKRVILWGLVLFAVGCGKDDDFQAELDRCQRECEQRMNSPQCRIGGPNICMCHCELRQGVALATQSDMDSATGVVGQYEPAFLVGDPAAYSGVTAPARLSVLNASAIASATWGSAARVAEIARQSVDDAGTDTVSHVFDVSMTESTSGKTYLLEGYRVRAADSPAEANAKVVNGRLYDPDHGYINVSTTSPLRSDEQAGGPPSGVLVATSGDGTALTVSAFSDAVYQIVLERQ